MIRDAIRPSQITELGEWVLWVILAAILWGFIYSMYDRWCADQEDRRRRCGGNNKCPADARCPVCVEREKWEKSRERETELVRLEYKQQGTLGELIKNKKKEETNVKTN